MWGMDMDDCWDSHCRSFLKWIKFSHSPALMQGDLDLWEKSKNYILYQIEIKQGYNP